MEPRTEAAAALNGAAGAVPMTAGPGGRFLAPAAAVLLGRKAAEKRSRMGRGEGRCPGGAVVTS